MHIPEYKPTSDDDREPVGILPESPKARAAAQDWPWGDGGDSGDESLTPSQKDVYDRTMAVIGV